MWRGKHHLYCFLLFMFMMTSVFAGSQYNNLAEIAVLYPTVSKEHNDMFVEYIEGIRSVPGYNFKPLRITDDLDLGELRQWSKKNNIKGYIALGQTTYKLVVSLKSAAPLIAGGMVSTPPGINGISLSADPQAFFNKLQLLTPKVSRVFYVYSQFNNGWLIDRARNESEKYGINFVALKVDDVMQATMQYKIILESMKQGADALWIPLDNVVPMKILLPNILQTAWNKNFTVFSNNLQHTRRGTLFSLFPDHYREGRRLVALLEQRLIDNTKAAVLLPSVDLKLAVNTRTSSHLGMHFSQEMIMGFDQVYPSHN
ncbi:MAG: hypothetical protein OEY89_11715 [Gammaproteobacteria bacterium]|nr:hypothetical protein [Gammaproteobacteria bacterium]